MKSTEELKALETNVKMKAKEKLQSTHIRTDSDLESELKNLNILITGTQSSILKRVSGEWLLALYIYEAWEEAPVKVDPSISVESIEQMLKNLNLLAVRRSGAHGGQVRNKL